MEFEWDPVKGAANIEKHGVTFSKASTIFGDPFEVTIPDPSLGDDTRPPASGGFQMKAG